ncbi:MAG: polysaccharide pyruvyl transferase CsaB [Parasynechococcus sp.]|uniref:polysaccharide pyruvyl transferase CsaB n=1 Tax=Parasynechococcus sp. TaxID=3101203 RepID=UPI00388987EE
MTVAGTGTRTLLLCGYYGENNLGDDALLLVLLQQIPAGFSLLITANDQEALRALAPMADGVARRSLGSVLAAVGRADALILGGGSLLQDSTSLRSLIYYLLLIVTARIQRRPILLWGQGLGPLNRPTSRWLVRQVLPLCTAASWRDRSSLERSRRWAPRLPAQMAPDPVWQMPPQSWSGGVSIVVCWRPTSLLDDSGWSVLLSALDDLAEQLQAPVRWLAFHQHQDAVLFDALKERGLIPASLAARSSTIVPRSVETVFATVRKARLVVPMRLHALILARLTGCPMAALSYDPKVEAAAEMADVPWLKLDKLPTAASILSQWLAAADAPADPQTIEQIRTQASAHGRMLEQFLQR